MPIKHNPQTNMEENIEEEVAQDIAVTSAVGATIWGIENSVENSLYLLNNVRSFLGKVIGGILLPVTAIEGIISAILAWREAQLKHHFKDKVKAVFKTISAIGILVAVVGGIAASTTFAVATPAIIAAFEGANTLLKSAELVHLLYSAFKTKNPELRKQYFDTAKEHGISLAASILVLIAMAAILMNGHIALAASGILGGIVASGYTIYTSYKKIKNYKKAAAEQLKEDVELVENPELLATYTKVMKKMSPELTAKHMQKYFAYQAEQTSEPKKILHHIKPSETHHVRFISKSAASASAVAKENTGTIKHTSKKPQ